MQMGRCCRVDMPEMYFRDRYWPLDCKCQVDHAGNAPAFVFVVKKSIDGVLSQEIQQLVFILKSCLS